MVWNFKRILLRLTVSAWLGGMEFHGTHSRGLARFLFFLSNFSQIWLLRRPERHAHAHSCWIPRGEMSLFWILIDCRMIYILRKAIPWIINLRPLLSFFGFPRPSTSVSHWLMSARRVPENLSHFMPDELYQLSNGSVIYYAKMWVEVAGGCSFEFFECLIHVFKRIEKFVRSKQIVKNSSRFFFLLTSQNVILNPIFKSTKQNILQSYAKLYLQ